MTQPPHPHPQNDVCSRVGFGWHMGALTTHQAWPHLDLARYIFFPLPKEEEAGTAVHPDTE